MTDENREHIVVASATDILDWLEKGFRVFIRKVEVESGTEGGVKTVDGVWHPTHDIQDEDVDVIGPPKPE